MNDSSIKRSLLERISIILAERIRLAHILAITSLLLLPSLSNTFYGDDFHHYAQLNGNADALQVDDLSLFGLFSFVGNDPDRRQLLKEYSIIPWWAGESFNWKFWRPVTEITLYIDYVILKLQPLMHLHSIIWYLAVTGLLYVFFRRIFEEPSVALLATSLFALNGAHGLLVGWLCARSPLIACFFAMICLLFYHNSITKGGIFLLLSSVIAFVFSLLSAEMGIATTAWLFAYALFIDKRSSYARLLNLIPFALVVIVWWLIYRYSGFGVSASNDFYIDPASQPLALVARFFSHIPILVFSQLAAIPSDLFYSGMPRYLAILAGALALLLVYVFYRQSHYKQFILFFMTGSLLSIFPLASAPLQDRNVIFVSIGFAGILALLIYKLWCIAIRRVDLKFRFMLFGLLFLHFFVSPLVLIVMSQSPTFLAGSALQRAGALEYNPRDQLVVIGAPVMEIAYLVPSLLYLNESKPKSVWNLVGIQRDFELHKAGDNMLRLSSKKGLINSAEQFVRSLGKEPFTSGDEVLLNGLEIKIINANNEGHPQEVVYVFDKPLTHYNIVRWDKEKFVRLDLDDFPVINNRYMH